MAELARRRADYESVGLDVADVVADPIEQWQRWYGQAAEAGCVEPNAFVLGTVDADGYPQTRYLLARGADERGFVFFTNYESAKGTQLAEHPRASMLFTWLQLHRQLRITGSVERASVEESDAYFASRPRASQIGAWASPQSQRLTDRSELEARVAGFEATFAGVDEVPRPVFWGGWRLVPVMIELWQGRPSRLHDRVRYTRTTPADAWEINRLAP
ncbi:MAG: pyridoxamine 5'-phosphate oxidase [Ilumatobacteraceae bacterium]